jgi:hypothetical protein
MTPPTVPPPSPVECGLTETYAADADAWINQGGPADNKGNDSTLKVMSKAGSNLRGLVRFAMPAAIPDGCVVQLATLWLFAGSSAGGRTLEALQINAPWAEGSVSWSNQPSTTGAAATTISGAGSRQWDVTAQVQAMLGSGVNHGFLIRDAVEGQDAEQQFHSREKGESVPQLIVTYAPAPAATTNLSAVPTTTAVTTPPAPTTTAPSPPTTTTVITTSPPTPSTTTAPAMTTTAPSTTTTLPEPTTTAPPSTTPPPPTTTTPPVLTTPATTG